MQSSTEGSVDTGSRPPRAWTLRPRMGLEPVVAGLGVGVGGAAGVGTVAGTGGVGTVAGTGGVGTVVGAGVGVAPTGTGVLTGPLGVAGLGFGVTAVTG